MINMKYYNKLWLSAVAMFVLASCAEKSMLDYSVDKPESIAQLEYLNDFDVLKSYVDRSTNPNFKLGAGVSVADFTAKARGYSHIVTNFDEVTAGWEMKHAGVVKDDGSLDFANVNSFITTAKDAGISIYGHALCWHANQNAKYLNSKIGLLDPTLKIWDVLAQNDFETSAETYYSTSASNAIKGFTADGEGYNGVGRALTITNSAVRANDWDSQFYITFPKTTAVGEQYTLTMDIRSDAPATYPTQAQTAPGAYKFYDFFGQLTSTTAWFHFSKTITISSNTSGCNTIALNLGKVATTFYFDNLKVTRLRPGATGSYELISGADFETSSTSNYQSNSNAVLSYTAVGEGANASGRALKITNSAVRANDWDAQFFLTFSPAMKEGEKYKLTMDVKADAACSFGTQAHVVPYQYKTWDFFGNIDATTTWAPFSKEITVTADMATTGAIAFNLGKNATTYYFDNIQLTKYKAGGLERTPEEKTEIITGELDRWIKGMLDVSKDYVKAWDVVNEPMDDGNPYNIKTGVGKTLKADEFYWQDYMGKDYAVQAFKLAAQYGNATDKLFINDYNLEYSIDKCKGLIAYVQYIESQGARVDGIGTQMHISTTADKAKIDEMFTLLAQTGKLIKISELDLGIDNKKTAVCTDADYQAQAEMYKYVVKKYFELIPAAQRYGITIWSPLDSPAGSGWRPDEPIGLWNKDYSRKHAYAGVANALSGK